MRLPCLALLMGRTCSIVTLERKKQIMILCISYKLINRLGSALAHPDAGEKLSVTQEI